jgi:hypothetical protein
VDAAGNEDEDTDNPIAKANRNVINQAALFEFPFQYFDARKKMETALKKLTKDERNDPEVHRHFHKLYGEEVEVPEVLSSRTVGKEEEEDGGLETFRNYFCRQCLTFDCPIHICQDKDAATLAVVALEYNRSKKNPPVPIFPPLLPRSMPSTVKNSKPLSSGQLSILSRLHMIFERDSKKLSAATGGKYDHELATMKLKETPLAARNPKDFRLQSRKAKITSEMAKSITEMPGLKAFPYPCSHAGQCSEENNCDCVKNNHVCTHACIWGIYGSNFFKGCNCTAGCVHRKKLCDCALANRECVPGICRCICCTNMKITNRERRPLFVGPSTIPEAGYGAFAKEAIKAGEYIDEVSECLCS